MKKLFLFCSLFFVITLSAQDFKVGDSVPKFKLWMTDGTRITQDSIKNKVTVFKFWFTTCPPCKADIPELNKLVDEYQNNSDVLFIAPALDRKDVIEHFIHYNPFKFKIAYSAMDVSQQLNKYQAYPFYYVVGKDGKFVYVDNPKAKSQTNALKKVIKKALKI